MPLNPERNSVPSSVSHMKRVQDLWPLAAFFVLLALAGVALYQFWPRISFNIILWQRELHQHLANLLQQVKVSPATTGMSLVLFSLIYGVIHAAGPGHGKIVITTYLATHPSRLKNSMKLTFASALVQGLVAILLVTVLLVVLQLPSRQLHQSSLWLERGSFVLVMLLGVLLCWRALKNLHHHFKQLKVASGLTIRRLQPLPAGHQHDKHCGCGHQHMPSDAQLKKGDDWRTQLTIVLAMGMRPCSGAIMVLLFSKVIGVYFWGVLSVLAMAFGTSLTVSLIGLMVFYSRSSAEKLSARRAPAIWQNFAWPTLAFTGGIILLVVGWLLFRTADASLGVGGGPFG